MFTRERSGSGALVVGVVRDGGRVVVVDAVVDGAGLVGAVDVVLECFPDELHAARTATASAVQARRTGRG